MSEKTNAPAAVSQPAITQEQLDKARADGIAAGKAEAAAEAAAAATKAATDRVKAITSCEAAKDRPALAAHLAFETDMAADAAIALLAKAGSEVAAAPANPLAGAMAGTNPKVRADGEPAKADGGGVTVIDTAAVYQRMKTGPLAVVK